MKKIILISSALLVLNCVCSKEPSEKEVTAVATENSTSHQQAQGGAFEPPKEDDSKAETPQQHNETADVSTPEKENPTEENPTGVNLETIDTSDNVGVSESIETTALEAFDHTNFDELLKKHVTKEGNVNYKGFKNDAKLLQNYIVLLGQSMPKTDWTKEDKLAYWINAYNAMTIDLIVRNYPIASIKDIDKPWEQRLWKLESKWYNLDEIEHQILRKMNEPRIHFGIVCASFSCPKLQNEAFNASNLEHQLTDATKEFLADTKRNNISENNLKLSKIFKWFANDFKQDGSLIDFLNKYSEVTISNNAKKSFKNYNWDLNE